MKKNLIALVVVLAGVIAAANLGAFGREPCSARSEISRWSEWKIRAELQMPAWYQRWSSERAFWRNIRAASSADDPWNCLVGAMAAAELNRRLGDDSLMLLLDKSQ